MKGLIEHIINENAIVEREINRDHENISAPYLLEEFKEWLPNVVDSQGTVLSYVSSMNSLDELIVPSDVSEDFYLNLQKYFERKEYDKIPALLEDYEDEITEWYEWTKKADDYNTRPKHISDMRSAFRKYKLFISERILEERKSKAIVSEKNSKRMFLRNEFIQWLQDNGTCTKESAKSNASRVNSLNNNFLSKLIKGKAFNFLELLPHFIKNHKGKTILLLDKLENRVYDSNVKPEDFGINESTFRNMKRAFSLYVSFIKEQLDDGTLLSDDLSEATKEEIINENVDINVSKVRFDVDFIKDKFRFRLLTQDRLSNSKSVFYPIRLIRRIFTNHDKLVRLGLINGEPTELKYLLDIFNKRLETIHFITDKGIFKLNDIDYLNIEPISQIASITLKNGEQAILMTKTDTGETERMQVSSFKDISIDHVVSMADILIENENRLQTLRKLTEILKKVAKANNIDIIPSNTCMLYKKTMDEVELSRIFHLIPTLKEEISIIENATELQLMSKTYNIRKK